MQSKLAMLTKADNHNFDLSFRQIQWVALGIAVVYLAVLVVAAAFAKTVDWSELCLTAKT